MKNRFSPQKALLALGLATTLAAGCSPTTAPATSTPVPAETTTTDSGTPQETPTPATVVDSDATATPGGATTPSAGAQVPTVEGVEITVIKAGSGEPLVSGNVGTFHYTGWLEGFEKGEPFDSSRGRTPFNTAIGRSQVIPGWDQGLVGMQPGEIRRLVVSPEMGYGAGGAGPIPPNATLYFEVEYLGPG